MELEEIISRKKVLFISFSDHEYLRNKQEIEIIKKYSLETTIITANKGQKITPINIGKILLVYFKTFFYLCKSYDIIFIGGLPQILLPCIHPFIKNKIIIIDFFISLYDTMIEDRTVVNKQSLLSYLLMWLDKQTISLADHILVDTKTHGEYFKNKLSAPASKIIILYLKADTDIYHPKKIKKLQCFQGKFLVFFFGAMNPVQGVEVILNCAATLIHEQKIVFAFVGPMDKLKYAINKRMPSNVIWLSKWLPQNIIADLITMSDLCLAGHFSSEVPKAKRVIPGKAFTYLAMNKKTILGDNDANREFFSETNNNIIFVKMGDHEALKKTILNSYHEFLRKNSVDLDADNTFLNNHEISNGI
ncbi:Glycosyltransferase involved in cell wall bisynthesis [Desulfocicer vacuolatum DSM 3385]|uniref:Glycosyltransferase involved in cell wall bisynthesis n=1 Tax=Desulfocicer vacuolatum DSM 3385 TaxID=1121400 RepID=A0A1W2BJA9_9BACT|nr:glycosyltransferase [Desulfocicer vacuolatum]SMC72966.1 Glycosyltransferase involved in cell wall bisynthesis [Desulfocicer vacuolatum DSM 3385]